MNILAFRYIKQNELVPQSEELQEKEHVYGTITEDRDVDVIPERSLVWKLENLKLKQFKN